MASIAKLNSSELDFTAGSSSFVKLTSVADNILNIQGVSPTNNSLLTNCYVDTQTWKAAVTVSTVDSNITLSGLQTIDGVALSESQRVLVKNQTDPIENGIYNASSGSWSRSTDMPQASIAGASSVIIRSGTIQINQTWQCISGTLSQVGVDPLVFVQTTGLVVNQLNVNKNPSIDEFSSIYDAVQSITSSSSSNRYVICVGPGIYDEQQINLPIYTSVTGDTINATVVRPQVPNQYVFVMNTVTEISFMTLQGIPGSLAPGPGAGYSAVYIEDVGDFAQMHKLSIYDFDIGVDNYSNLTDSTAYLEYIDINGDYSYAVRNRSNVVPNGSVAYMNCENFYTYESNSDINTVVYNVGIDTYFEITAALLSGSGSTTAKGLVSENGGNVGITAIKFQDFGANAITSLNVGAGAYIAIDSCSFENCTLDFEILNTGTTGYFVGYSALSNHYIVPGSTFFMANEQLNTVHVSARGGDFTSIKAAVDSITDASSANPYIVDVGPGMYTEDTIILKEGIFVLGSMTGGSVVMPSTSSNSIMVGVDGSLVKDMFFSGTTSTSAAAVYYSGTTGAGFLLRDCGFSNNALSVHAHGAGTTTGLIVDRCSITGNAVTCFKTTNSGSAQVRLTLLTHLYQDLVAPVCTYFVDAQGTNTLLTVTNTIIRVFPTSGATAFYFGSNVEARFTAVTVKGFGNGIHVPSGSSNCNINGGAIIFQDSVNYDVLIENSTTIGSVMGVVSYTKTSIDINSLFSVEGANVRLINVQKAGGDFTSIYDAINSITLNSSTNNFLVSVGPGTFLENPITMKPYVGIVGAGQSTIIQSANTASNLITSCDYSYINSCVLTGAGTGYSLVYHESPTGTQLNSFTLRDVIFGHADTLVSAYSNSGSSNVYIFSSRCGGSYQFNNGFSVTNNNNSVSASIHLMSCTNFGFNSPVPEYFSYVSGINCKIVMNGVGAIFPDTPEIPSTFLYLENGANAQLNSVVIQGFIYGIYVSASGTAPYISIDGSNITDCISDISILNTGTLGAINMSADRDKITVSGTPPVSLFITEQSTSGISMNGPFYYANSSWNNITDISEMINDTPTMGLLYGGTLSASNSASILSISDGYGYVALGTEPTDYLVKREWTQSYLAISANTTVYVYMNTSGTFVSNSTYPDTEQNLLLGSVSTNSTDIIYIQSIPVHASHYSNDLNVMLRNGIGPIYSSGSITTESTSTPGQVCVTEGLYYFTNLEFNPTGGTDIPFDIYYRSGTPGIYTSITGATLVPSGFYDNGSGTLAALSTGFFVKHLLCVVGGPSEKYALIYGQTEFSTSGLAVAGGIPIVPSFVTDSFANIASIVMEEGVTAIDTIVDERPRIGFASSSATGTVTVHGDLLGLSADDHPQYLLRSGTSAMTGNLNMGTGNVTNAGTYNSVTVEAHASRHAFNGADPLNPALAADISEISDSTNSAGINNTKIPRADHVHAHGNRGGGSLHSLVIAGSAAGFMSGSDKAKLDGIASGATNTTVATAAPLNVSKSTASAGISPEVSRYDHKHDIDTAAPTLSLSGTTTNLEGSSTSLSRADHSHVVIYGVATTQTPDQANATGNQASFALSDHVHNIPTAVAVGLNADSASTQGAAASFARSNHSHAIESTVPANQTITATPLVGVSTGFARADHIHSFSVGNAVNVGTSNFQGSLSSFARSDHIHDHGFQTNPSQHALATASNNGFMSNIDKSKLDAIPAGLNTYIQYNNNGVIGASSGLTYNGSSLFVNTGMTASILNITGLASVQNLSATSVTLSNVNISNVNVSNLTSTAITTGGINVTGLSSLQNVNSTGITTGSLLATLDSRVISTTDSISTTSGALVVSGGIGVGKSVNIGGTLATNVINSSATSTSLTVVPNTTIQGLVAHKVVSGSINTAGDVTYTASQVYNGVISRDPNGANRTDTFPTASSIISLIQNPVDNISFEFIISNTAGTGSYFYITLATGTGITLVGRTTISSGEVARFIAVVTSVGSNTITIYSLTQGPPNTLLHGTLPTVGSGTQYIQWGLTAGNTGTFVNNISIGRAGVIRSAQFNYSNLTNIGITGADSVTFSLGTSSLSGTTFTLLTGGANIVTWNSTVNDSKPVSTVALYIPITQTDQLSVRSVETGNVTPNNANVNVCLVIELI